MKLPLIQLLLPTVWLLGACIPILEVKAPQTFTDKRVKAMQFDDACRLQAYFDAKPPRPEVASERSTVTGTGSGAGGGMIFSKR